MATFHIDELSFDLPGRAWREHTINFFDCERDPDAPKVIISRTPQATGSLAQLVDEAIGRARIESPSLRLAGVRESRLGPLPATEVLFALEDGPADGPMLEQQIHFKYYGAAVSIRVLARAADRALVTRMAERILSGTVLEVQT